MKKLLLLLLMPLALIAAPRKRSMEEMKQRFVQGCMESIRDNKVDAKYVPLYKNCCECSGEIFVNKFSLEEMEKINQIDKKSGMDARQQKLLQQRLTEMIAPCIEELKRKIAEAQ